MAHAIEQALDNAVTRITARGWTQGVWANPDGKVCLLGAIYNATWDDEENCTVLATDRDKVANGVAIDAEHFVLDVLRERPDFPANQSVPYFNDEVLTAEADAIAVLEKARARVAEVGV